MDRDAGLHDPSALFRFIGTEGRSFSFHIGSRVQFLERRDGPFRSTLAVVERRDGPFRSTLAVVSNFPPSVSSFCFTSIGGVTEGTVLLVPLTCYEKGRPSVPQGYNEKGRPSVPQGHPSVPL